MSTVVRSLRLGVFTIGLTVASTAGAQSSTETQTQQTQPAPQTGSTNALAEALFKQGKALLEAKRYDEACPKLAESLRLVSGTGTLIALALCHEDEGKLATAWMEFRNALAAAEKAGRGDRITLARQHIASVEPRLSTLTIQPAARVEGMQLKVNGEVLDAAALGTPVPMDGGDYELRLGAPGYEAATLKVHLDPASDAKTVDLPPLTPSPPVPSASAPEPGPSPSSASPVSPTSSSAGGRTSGAKALAIAGGSVAVVGAVAVAVAGAITISKSNQARSLCGDGGQCSNSVALSAASDAQTFSTIANVGVGAVVVGAAAFVVGMWVLPRNPTPDAPSVAFDGRQEMVTWRW